MSTEYTLDLRGVACPMNFVKTKLFLDKVQSGDLVKVLLDQGEPVTSVTSSVQAEGHELVDTLPDAAGYCLISIRKV